MKNIWKWILGILIVLIVVAAFAALPYLLHTAFGMPYGGPAVAQGFERQAWRMPMHDFDGRSFDRFGPMMGGRGYSGFNPLFAGFMLLGGLLRLVVPLGIVALIAWLAYQQGKKVGMKSTAPAAPAPVSESPASES